MAIMRFTNLVVPICLMHPINCISDILHIAMKQFVRRKNIINNPMVVIIVPSPAILPESRR